MAHLAEFATIYEGILKMKPKLEKAQGHGPRANFSISLSQATTSSRTRSTTLQVWSKEIVALDADNKAGLKTKYQCRLLMTEAEQHWLRRSGSSPRRLPSSTKPWSFPALSPSKNRTFTACKASITAARKI